MSAVEVRFWDGQRYYEGEARQLCNTYVLARIRIFDNADVTILPQRELMEGLKRHLVGRVVPIEIGKGENRADLLAKLEGVEPDPANPRRAVVKAAFTNPSAVESSKLTRLMDETRVID